jgi:hypothetical protein
MRIVAIFVFILRPSRLHDLNKPTWFKKYPVDITNLRQRLVNMTSPQLWNVKKITWCKQNDVTITSSTSSPGIKCKLSRDLTHLTFGFTTYSIHIYFHITLLPAEVIDPAAILFTSDMFTVLCIPPVPNLLAYYFAVRDTFQQSSNVPLNMAKILFFILEETQ